MKKWNFKEFEINTDLVKEILYLIVFVALVVIVFTGCTPNKEVPLKLPYDVKLEEIV